MSSGGTNRLLIIKKASKAQVIIGFLIRHVVFSGEDTEQLVVHWVFLQQREMLSDSPECHVEEIQ